MKGYYSEDYRNNQLRKAIKMLSSMELADEDLSILIENVIKEWKKRKTKIFE